MYSLVTSKMPWLLLLAHAHLMVTQHGSLNIVDDGAYMLRSFATSSFEGIDDNSDGDISLIESPNTGIANRKNFSRQ